jgi:endonuclease/exonuclease/phosphatase family metal-dependent hydrolase
MLLPGVSFAQVSLGGGTYLQDFNSLTNSGTASWTDNVTLPGWYASRSVAPHSVTNYNAGNGSSATGAFYSFGEPGSSDRALGSLASGGVGRLAFGIRLLNDTDSALTEFRVSYTGEQWRAGSSARQTLACSFQIGSALTNADAPNDQAWTPCAGLDVVCPNTNAAGALNGNAPSNRVIFTAVPLPGVVVSPGQELFLRWEDVDDPGYDDAPAIDDVRIDCCRADTNAAAPAAETAFSLLTYNTHGNEVEDWSTNAWQVRAIGRQLIYLQPDIVVFNEIPETNTWQMENWVRAFLPGYWLATNSEGDGAIRNVIASRFSILHSQSWLHGVDLAPYGCSNATFRRDLFEAEIGVPGFPQPLHVFAVHLKSGQDAAVSSQRAGEAGAISNFFVTHYLPEQGWQPYVLCGDLNEDVARPPASHPGTLERLTGGPTGLCLTSPLNPFTQSEMTYSIQGDGLSRRYDYILPGAVLFSNLAGGLVFRSDPLTNAYPQLRTNDSRTASDHLPVLMAFRNPFDRPFRLMSIACDGAGAELRWESVPGQGYGLEHAFDLSDWTACADSLLATGWTFDFRTNATSNPEFFRVRRSP